MRPMLLKRIYYVGLALSILISTPRLRPLEVEMEEESLKAYFVINFMKYISWPQGAVKSEFVVGVYQSRRFIDDLKQISRELEINGFPISIKYIENINEAAAVHVLVVPNERAAELAALHEGLKTKPVLFISEGDSIDINLTGIHLLVIDHRVKFIIHRTNIQNAGLSVSSKLLQLSLEVY